MRWVLGYLIVGVLCALFVHPRTGRRGQLPPATWVVACIVTAVAWLPALITAIATRRRP